MVSAGFVKRRAERAVVEAVDGHRSEAGEDRAVAENVVECVRRGDREN